MKREPSFENDRHLSQSARVHPSRKIGLLLQTGCRHDTRTIEHEPSHQHADNSSRRSSPPRVSILKKIQTKMSKNKKVIPICVFIPQRDFSRSGTRYYRYGQLLHCAASVNGIAFRNMLRNAESAKGKLSTFVCVCASSTVETKMFRSPVIY